MNFQKTLISGEFIKRYKRFFVDVKIGNNTVTAHCPNTGSMLGLLNKGNKVFGNDTLDGGYEDNIPKDAKFYKIPCEDNSKLKQLFKNFST